MKVKRDVKVCDYCYDKDDDELQVARYKCKICNKDLCDNCCKEYYLSLGDDNGCGDVEEIRLVEIDCCGDCIKGFHVQPRKDKKFIDNISKQIIHYFKQKVMLQEIEK